MTATGIEVTEDPETSRKLILPTSDPALRVIIVRASDVPTYVQYGAADFGVAGRDTEDFVRGAVVGREGVDAIAPTAAGPAVLGEEAFEECGGIRGTSG